jgi:DNA-binding transcriptional regulator YdaS (Cro superfamily)
MENSTNIMDLPTDPANGGQNTGMNGPNVKMVATEQQSASPMTLDQTTINQIVSGLQQASASGATQLASRDIPMTTSNIMQDQEVRPNYIPPIQTNNYISEHENKNQSPYDIMNDYNKNIERNGQLDDIYKEIQVPLLLAVLYFLFQLPIFKKWLFSYFPILFSNDGNFNINGYLFTSVLFSILYYLLDKINKHFDAC